ncbi:Ldh family oxidoreductase [Kutzneria viridogrisea]|uniref:Malate/L-lactate dehydrogenase n=2 Tax=Kutzneria TaxID=43356 RepID=W5W2W7_9PSEU|nr:Ldh family oxidoreductase [Kutzneria albida]AHH95182.1 malate/L-lactate dehydrogenase [Kutzneria albida DSM 43870]MBA8927461.1 LDH2 family malate/lactate/ureidoglycolate dehydrogenase [Kutzneria viridogrisea]
MNDTVLVPHRTLLSTVAGVFAERGLAPRRAEIAAEALCHGDLTGVSSHGLVNLTRLYLPLFAEGRTDPLAELEILNDLGACLHVDAHEALGLWAAAEAVKIATERASRFGLGLVSLRRATHIGCAGYHALRAARQGMIGLIASNCGGQRIAPPPGGLAAMLGTNPLSLACPAGAGPPFVLDMSTTVVPTGRIRAAARAGDPIPAGWLAGRDGEPVTDPAALDRGEAHLRWLGGSPETGSYKGFGLGLLVEVLAALLPGAALGPVSDSGGRDEDIGVLALVIAPEVLRPGGSFAADSARLFRALLDCPPVDPAQPVRYPGWPEAERAARNRVRGIPLPRALFEELSALAPELREVG